MYREPLLKMEDLQASFITKNGILPAVDMVSMEIGAGETVGLVGESGCGKTLTSLSVMRLLPEPGGIISNGRILFEGQDLVQVSDKEMRAIRGNQISMIFQEPMTSLNPVYTIGNQITDVLRLHQGLSKAEASRKAVDMLAKVGIPNPEQRIKEHPHKLSGGMRQRVMIGIALACRPKLLIADEPTTALDVTIQAQILQILKNLKKDLGMSILLITHDLGVVAGMADRVLVMYAGKIVEEAPVRELFHEPKHPYTKGLLNSIPKIDRKNRLHVIEGVVPDIGNMPQGCRFHPRCPQACAICEKQEPGFTAFNNGQRVSCWLYSDQGGAENECELSIAE